MGSLICGEIIQVKRGSAKGCEI